MGALDQVVVAHQILLAGDRRVVALQVEGAHVAVQEMPVAVIVDLGDAVPRRVGGAGRQSRRAPEVRE
jgi:hypothetical protein